MSRRNTTTLSEGLTALFEQTEQRIRDGVRSAATLEMQVAHGVWLARELGAATALEALEEPILEQLAFPPGGRRRFGAETLRKRMSTLRGVLQLAHRRRWISRVPAFPVVIAPWRPRQRFLERYEDAVRLFEALPIDRAEWMWACLWTWQHPVDVDAMTWADLSLDEPTRSFVRRNTKNRKVPLRVAMPRPLWRVLRARFERERPSLTAPVVRPWPGSRKTLPMACYRLGLPPCTAIDLRHTGITWAVRKLGITPAVMAYAGHGSAAMMSRTYAHAMPVSLSEVTAELDSMAGEPPGAPGTKTPFLAHPGAFGAVVGPAGPGKVAA